MSKKFCAICEYNIKICRCDKDSDYGVVDYELNHTSWHPLVNDDSPHYKLLDGSQSILLFEKMFTKDELMSWSKITSFKYRMRLGKKDSDESDIRKMKTYEDYYKYLEAL